MTALRPCEANIDACIYQTSVCVCVFREFLLEAMYAGFIMVLKCFMVAFAGFWMLCVGCFMVENLEVKEVNHRGRIRV